MQSSEEWFPVVDEDGNELFQAPRSMCHDGRSMMLHPVVHLHLFNDREELFLQKRAATKDILPGKWDTSVGGHISHGESVENALIRETSEELGLTKFSFYFNKKYIWKSALEKELVWSFTGESDETPVTDPEEIETGRFWNLQEIEENLGKDIFTPNFEFEFNMLYITPSGIREETI